NGFRGTPGALYEWFFRQDDIDTRQADPRLLHNELLTFPIDSDSEDFPGLTGGGVDTNPAFDYFVRTYHVDDPRSFVGVPTDESPLLTCDPGQRKLSFDRGASSPFPLYKDFFGAYVRTGVDLPGGSSTQALVLHHFNAPGSRAEVVRVET